MIVITGASDGLGRELTKLFLLEGKRVIGISRGTCENGVEHLETDLLTDSSIEHTAEIINKDKTPLEALINCAGVMSFEKINALTPKQIDKVLGVNIRAPMLLTSKLMDKIKKDGADIVNIASTVGMKGYADQAAYGASKWAMRGFSANLQVELKNYPSRVLSICTGGFKSTMVKKATGIDNTTNADEWMKAPDVARMIKQLIELPKNMEVSEIVINRKTTQ